MAAPLSETNSRRDLTHGAPSTNGIVPEAQQGEGSNPVPCGVDSAWHTLDVDVILTRLKSDPVQGLSEAEAEARVAIYGRNELTVLYKPGFLRRLWAQVNNIIIWILVIAAIVSGILGDYAELALIAAVVVINVLIGMIQEGKAEKAAEALKAMLAPKATVVRDGQRQSIDAVGLVPGDVVFFQSGDRIAADCRLFNVSNLQIQESMLTGESLPIAKNTLSVPPEAALGDRKCLAFSGTLVMQGQGMGYVVATGDNAELGKINLLVAGQEEPPTPILVQLELFGRFIAVMTIILAVVSFLFIYLGRDLAVDEAFLAAVSIAVAIIPEGLPSIVTVTLALGVQNMARQNAIVRKLPAVETLGAVTVICSDKTGTLTKNEMTVVAVQTSSDLFRVTGVGYQPGEGRFLLQDEGSQVIPGAGTGSEVVASEQQRDQCRQLLMTGLLCNDGSLKPPVSVTPEGTLQPAVPVKVPAPPAPYGGWTISGDPTDVALLTASMKAGVQDILAAQSALPRLATVPFESSHKFQATVHKELGVDGAMHTIVHVKGAPERLIPRCTWQLSPGTGNDVHGPRVPVDSAWWRARVDALSSQGLRVLAYCRAEVPIDVDHEDWSDVSVADIAGEMAAEEGGENAGATSIEGAERHTPSDPSGQEGGPSRLSPYLTLTCLVAILDPPRVECIQAISEAHSAGIVVKMITGDHKETALAIGRALGIVQLGGSAFTGPELDRMDDAEFSRTVHDCNVFARASPENKIRIVKALQALGEVTSMTGDGVNDAPALKAATIGVAMGITGTDVSKEAAKMVLADDNFATIVSAVKEGRHVWDNLVKILVFTLPTNMSQGFVVLFAYILDMSDSPLTAFQVLYINMATSVTSGIALAFEPAEPDIMSRPPRSPKKRLLSNNVLWRTMYVTIILVIFVLGNFQWSVDQGHQTNRCRAVSMSTLVVAQASYLLSCRFVSRSSVHPRVFFGNKWVWIAIAVNLGAQFLIVYTPGLDDLFDTGGENVDNMSALEWLRVFGFAIALFFIVELEKWLGPRYLRPWVLPLVEALDRMMPRVVLGWPWKYKLKRIPAAEAAEGASLGTEAGVSVPPEEEGPVPVAFIATSASTFGYPTHPMTLRRSFSRAIGISDSEPVEGRPSRGSSLRALDTQTQQVIPPAPLTAPDVALGRHVARYASGRGATLLSHGWNSHNSVPHVQVAVLAAPCEEVIQTPTSSHVSDNDQR